LHFGIAELPLPFRGFFSLFLVFLIAQNSLAATVVSRHDLLLVLYGLIIGINFGFDLFQVLLLFFFIVNEAN
jgi:hypothetical protein